MSTTFTQLSSCNPSSHDNAYIYQIAPLANGRMVATTSADEVLVVDVREAQLSPSDVLLLRGAPSGLTALSLGEQGNELYVGDQSGKVSHFDVRAGGKTGAIDIGLSTQICDIMENAAEIIGRSRSHSSALSRI